MTPDRVAKRIALVKAGKMPVMKFYNWLRPISNGITKDDDEELKEVVYRAMLRFYEFQYHKDLI